MGELTDRLPEGSDGSIGKTFRGSGAYDISCDLPWDVYQKSFFYTLGQPRKTEESEVSPPPGRDYGPWMAIGMV